MKKVIILFILSYGALNAQSGIVVSGSDAGNEDEKSVTSTIGQIFYQSYRDGPETYSISEGLQQPYEFFILPLDLDDPELELIVRQFEDTDYDFENLELQVFPNPFTNYVSVMIKDYRVEMQYYIHDNQGRTLFVDLLREAQTTINFSEYPTGIYYLTITNQNKPIKTIKLLKQQL